MKPQNIKIDLLLPNEGQIKGLPRNPRFIKNERFEKLKQSICEAPEMLEMRQLIVVEYGDKYVVLCGNMRLQACKELEYQELPCYVLPKNTDPKKLREYTIKDNIGYGETDWSILNTEWNLSECEDWGVDLAMEELNMGDFFNEEDKRGDKEKTLSIIVEIPQKYEDQLDDIREVIKVGLENYKGVTIK